MNGGVADSPVASVDVRDDATRACFGFRRRVDDARRAPPLASADGTGGIGSWPINPFPAFGHRLIAFRPPTDSDRARTRRMHASPGYQARRGAGRAVTRGRRAERQASRPYRSQFSPASTSSAAYVKHCVKKTSMLTMPWHAAPLSCACSGIAKLGVTMNVVRSATPSPVTSKPISPWNPSPVARSTRP